MMVTICVYDIETGKILYIDKGHPEAVTNEIPVGADFTMLEPPDYIKTWQWLNDKWVELEPINNPDIKYNDISIWSDTLKQWVIDDNLVEEQKTRNQLEVWEFIKAKRSESITDGVLVKSVDKLFQTNNTSMIQYSNISGMIAIDNYIPVNWKTEDNTYVLLTIDLFKELQNTININTQNMFMIAEDHKVEMLKLEDPTEYDYSTNWREVTI